MRAKEFITESKIIDYEGIKLNVAVDGANVDIRALRPDGQQMGYVVFDRDGQTLTPDDLSVDEKYQGQGVAKIMYDYVKSLGFRIEASYDQTEAGKGFWQKHRGEERVWEEVNPDIRHSEFKHELEIDGLRYTAETDNNSGYGNQLIIKVYDGNKEVANAEFYEEPHDKALISMNTWVISSYQGQNIATNMYAYAKMLGNDIMPSDTQTDQGERMWRSWNQSGQSKHILPKGQKGYRDLDEDSAPEILYHVTPTRNVKSILAKGLVPSIGARSSHLETQSNLFFFPSKDAVEDALMNWLGDEFPEDEPLALLAVSSNGLEGKFTKGAEYEYTVSSPVPPQNIKVVSTNI